MIQDKTLLNVIDKNSFKIVKSIPAHNYAIYDIVFLNGLNLLATASRDKTIKLWDANSFDFLVRISKENYDAHSHSVNSLYWVENKNMLLSAGDDQKIKIWKITNSTI